MRRRGPTQRVAQATDAVGDSLAQRDAAADAVAPYVVEIDAAERTSEKPRVLSNARIRERLDRLTLGPPARSIERGVGIEPLGR